MVWLPYEYYQLIKILNKIIVLWKRTRIKAKIFLFRIFLHHNNNNIDFF